MTRAVTEPVKMATLEKSAAVGKSTDFCIDVPGFSIDPPAPPSIWKTKTVASVQNFGNRRLNRFKTVRGRRFQLHATRGWKCIGRVTS